MRRQGKAGLVGAARGAETKHRAPRVPSGHGAKIKSRVDVEHSSDFGLLREAASRVVRRRGSIHIVHQVLRSGAILKLRRRKQKTLKRR